MTQSPAKAHILMCRPKHFGVTYTINPWMDPLSWAQNDRGLTAASQQEWTGLYRTLRRLGADIELVPSAPGLPDLVFTANAAVVLDRKVLLARFRHPERQGEEAHFETTFQRLRGRGVVDIVRKLPEGVLLEGAGDCVWDDARQMFWLGYGPRSDIAARDMVAETFGAEVVALELADHRFYHMDTALSPLPRGEVMYVPNAFTAAGLADIHARVPPKQRIELGETDASALSANAVCIGDDVVMSACSERLRATLAERGYAVHSTPLPSFLRSGGSAFCLTLRLDRMSLAAQRAEAAVA